MDVLTFNGQSFADFHTFWDGKDLFVTPEKDVTFYEIPGRNGEVSVSNDRFKAKGNRRYVFGCRGCKSLRKRNEGGI